MFFDLMLIPIAELLAITRKTGQQENRNFQGVVSTEVPSAQI
jgi:hypothetical protein